MLCCSEKETLEGADYENIIGKLTKISIQIEPTWRGLYFCHQCKTYWEEQFIEDRFGGRPYLKKVNARYVRTEWGQDYLIEK